MSGYWRLELNEKQYTYSEGIFNVDLIFLRGLGLVGFGEEHGNFSSTNDKVNAMWIKSKFKQIRVPIVGESMTVDYHPISLGIAMDKRVAVFHPNVGAVLRHGKPKDIKFTRVHIYLE